MNAKEALAFIRQQGIVLQAAHGPVPNLAEEIAGGPIKGSWWAHPKSHEIFRVVRSVSESPDVLVCKLIDGKITYVHRRLWPALVKLATRFPQNSLAKVWDEHSKSGAHISRSIPFPDWVPPEVLKDAGELSQSEAEEFLSALPRKARKKSKAV
jgi:hypothetical protein